jgi:serine phosphatase RsbU (regulator of sigma subunit)
VVTDGVFEAKGPSERFGEERLRSELREAKDPSQVLTRIESSLQSFTNGVLDDDVAVIVLAPSVEAGSNTGANVPNLEVARG